jgi:hypothetical protein
VTLVVFFNVSEADGKYVTLLPAWSDFAGRWCRASLLERLFVEARTVD